MYDMKKYQGETCLCDKSFQLFKVVLHQVRLFFKAIQCGFEHFTKDFQAT